jgi:hypothetical protein
MNCHLEQSINMFNHWRSSVKVCSYQVSLLFSQSISTLRIQVHTQPRRRKHNPMSLNSSPRSIQSPSQPPTSPQRRWPTIPAISLSIPPCWSNLSVYPVHALVASAIGSQVSVLGCFTHWVISSRYFMLEPAVGTLSPEYESSAHDL